MHGELVVVTMKNKLKNFRNRVFSPEWSGRVEKLDHTYSIGVPSDLTVYITNLIICKSEIVIAKRNLQAVKFFKQNVELKKF